MPYATPKSHSVHSTNEASQASTPRYTHDCDTCVFLGRMDSEDLYYHAGENVLQRTVVARSSSKPSDYISGMEFAGPYRSYMSGALEPGVPQLVEAKRLAIAAGLLVEEPK
jgi:hypothetical protein